MKTKLFIRKAISKSGKPYTALILDLGYRQIFLSSKDNTAQLCAEILGVSVQEFMMMKDGDYDVE